MRSELIPSGKSTTGVFILCVFFDAVSTQSGALTWMLSSLEFPTYPATIHEYGTIIGTGNAIASWDTNDEKRKIKGVSHG